MVKNTKGGSKHKKQKNSSSNYLQRELLFREDCQDYGKVLERTGGNHIKVYLYNSNKEMRCLIRGSLRRKLRLTKDDTVLVALREYQDNAGDIIHQYTYEEVKMLVNYNEIVLDNDSEDNIDFNIVNDNEIDEI